MSTSPLPTLPLHCSMGHCFAVGISGHPSGWYQLGPASGGYSAAPPSGHRVLPYWLRWWQPSPGFTTGPEKLRQVFGYPSNQTRLIGFGQVEPKILFTGARNHHKWKTWKVSWSIPPCAPPISSCPCPMEMLWNMPLPKPWTRQPNSQFQRQKVWKPLNTYGTIPTAVCNR